MKRICCIEALAALFLCAGCDRATEPRFGEDAGTHSIVWLKSQANGAYTTEIRQDIVIQGRITGNDYFGEFPRTLVIEDDLGGISIAVAGGELFRDYPFGHTLTVRCNGLSLCDYGGKIVLAAGPSEYGPEAIPRESASRYLHVGQPPATAPDPLPLEIAAIGVEHADRYVRFDGVRFPDGGNWCTVDPDTGRHVTTEHRIVDASGTPFLVRAAASCSYADEPVPSGTGSLYGIVDYFNGKLSLRVTNYGTHFVSAATPPTTYP